MRSEDVVRSYSEYQRALCHAFQGSYSIGDREFLTDAPKHGAVTVLNDYWEFTRHGAGLRFHAVSSGIVIDVTNGVFTSSEFFDAWRLCEYLESISVDSLTFEDKRFDADASREIGHLLQLMTARKLLAPHPNLEGLVCCALGK